MNDLHKLATLIRYYILLCTTSAGSGHPTTSLSATDLMTVLFFKYLRFDLDNPDNPGNDRVIFSKGHASPLFYSLYAAAGKISETELKTMRQFDSVLEGHPTPRFRYTEAATGSLGQGLNVGVGMALALRARNPKSQIPNSKQIQNSNSQNLNNSDVSNFEIRDSNFPKVYTLLGDGEMAEGSVWEAIQLAAHYKLSNLVGILDVNRLAQSDATMYGHDVSAYEKRIAAFGWNVVTVDGHNLEEIEKAFMSVQRPVSSVQGMPTIIIAKTIKGKGVSFIEDKDGWHGKALKQEEFEKAVLELGKIDFKLRGKINTPIASENFDSPSVSLAKSSKVVSNSLGRSQSEVSQNFVGSAYNSGDKVATRQAYGTALARLGHIYPQVVALDADVKNSTYSEYFKKEFPDRFYDMYIAEQNMAGAAIGFARLGFVPFISTFAAFFTRAYDQIRMSALSQSNIKLVGSHAGVSIGEDGASQMGLEDFALFRAVFGSVVLHPADAIATEKLVLEMITHKGLVYMRTARPATPVIYDADEKFEIGGSKIFKSQITNLNDQEKVTIIAIGVTVHESLKAAEQLKAEGAAVDVIDCYSLKPIDAHAIAKAAQTSKALIIVEDHWEQGGLGDAVRSVFDGTTHPAIYHLAVSKMPRSGKPAELMDYMGISADAITKKVKEVVK